MLESILYFLLGFLAAALLALMVSPMIWQRAVSLTKRRIERSVPLTLNEIQADKDQMRAEFAMSTRRLELSVDELRERAARQIIEINKKRDDISHLAHEQAEKIHTIEELQTKSSELRVQLRQREEQLENMTGRLSEKRESLDEKALQFEQLRQNYEKAQTISDSSKIELVAKQTELEIMTDKLNMLNTNQLDGASNSIMSDDTKKLKNELAKMKASLNLERKKNQEAVTKLAALKHQQSGSDERLERRERDLSRLRETVEVDETTNAELNSELVNQQSHNVELQAKLAHANLQMEALLNDATNDNVEKAMASLESEKLSMASKLDDITSERDHLIKELSHIKNNNGSEWETERRENSLLRERINDLAARVTAMTASLEGDNSPINEILSQKDNAKASSRKKNGPAQRPATLADRIRALQDAAG